MTLHTDTLRWAPRRFIASVQELMRDEGKDQTNWTERRRRRLGADSSASKSARAMVMN